MSKTVRIPFRGPTPPPVAQRPKCPGCGEPRRPEIVVVSQRVERPCPITGRPQLYHVAVAREWRGKYRGYGHFCRLRCAAEYANRVASMGG